MKRAVFALLSTISGLVLLLGYKTVPVASTPSVALAGTGGTTTTSGTTTPSTTTPSTTTPSTTTPSTTSAGPSPSASAKAGAASRTVTGAAVDTRWGPVQVTATLSGGKVVAVTVVQVPQENPRDVQISSYAVPVLTAEAVAAGNADIDNVSGATYTSEGYKSSLQSALDQAGA
jgi:uncharacterized protein with FMN-binding domain